MSSIFPTAACPNQAACESDVVPAENIHEGSISRIVLDPRRNKKKLYEGSITMKSVTTCRRKTDLNKGRI